jgi:hypothetical protein
MALYALLRRIARYPFHSPFKMWSRYPGIARAVANPSTDTSSTQSANFLTMYSGIFASCFSALLDSSICTSHIVPHAGESSSIPASNLESGKLSAKSEGLLLPMLFRDNDELSIATTTLYAGDSISETTPIMSYNFSMNAASSKRPEPDESMAQAAVLTLTRSSLAVAAAKRRSCSA